MAVAGSSMCDEDPGTPGPKFWGNSHKNQGCVMAGKGSKRRPAQVPDPRVQENWARTFNSTPEQRAAEERRDRGDAPEVYQ